MEAPTEVTVTTSTGGLAPIDDMTCVTSSRKPRSDGPVAPSEKFFKIDRDIVYDHVRGRDLLTCGLQLDSDLYEYSADGVLSKTPLVANKSKYITSDMFENAEALQNYLALRGKIPPFLELMNSPGKGYGIFTKAPIKSGTYLGQYEGIVRPRTTNKDNLYVFNTMDFNGLVGPIVDADNIFFGNWTRFINDGKVYNISFASLRYQVLVFAQTDIPAGAELIGSYGEEYFKVHGIQKRD